MSHEKALAGHVKDLGLFKEKCQAIKRFSSEESWDKVRFDVVGIVEGRRAWRLEEEARRPLAHPAAP